MDWVTFKTQFGLAVLVALANILGCIFLWIAGNRKYSKQRRWARRLWATNTFYITALFIWVAAVIYGVPPLSP